MDRVKIIPSYIFSDSKPNVPVSTAPLKCTHKTAVSSQNTTLLDTERTLTSADSDTGAVKGETDQVASSSGSHTTDRHTGSTVVAASGTSALLQWKIWFQFFFFQLFS